jgi:hypothetical protein
VSKRSQTLLVFAVLILVTIGAAFFADSQFYGGRQNTRPQSQAIDPVNPLVYAERPERDYERDPDAVGLDTQERPRGLTPEAFAAWSAPSARAAMDAASALPPGDVDRAHLLRWIASACRPGNLGATPNEASPPEPAPGNYQADRYRRLQHEWHNARRKWCQGLNEFDMTVLSGAAGSAETPPPPSEVEAVALIDSLRNVDHGSPEWQDQAVIEGLWSIVEDSASPYLIRSAAHLLANTQDGSLALSSSVAEINAWANGMNPASQARLIRITAAELFFCRATLVCGPGTPMGFLGDPWISDEHRWTGREAVLRDALPTRHWQAAEHIAAAMQQRRAQAQAAQRRGGD